MSRGEQLSRQWQVLRVLENHRYGISIDDLAERLEVSRRTIERDLYGLSEMGFPIQSESREYGKKFWKLTRHFLDSGTLILSPTEIISLYLASHLVNPLAGTTLEESSHAMLNKIRAILPQTALNYFSELEETLYIKPSQQSRAIPESYLDDIRKAVKETTILKLEYKRDAKPFCVTLHPYGLIVYENSFYVLGYAEEAGNLRTFKLQRIKKIEPTHRKFNKPENFSLEKCIKGSFGIYDIKKTKPMTVRCEMRDWAARSVLEQKWHPTQIIEKKDGDVVIVSFLLHTTLEFIRWILGFGSMARIIEPEKIREEVVTEIEKTLSSYKK
ncbi:MAG: WYL domain-containing protein [Anaerolineales bacterium]|nr:WYL domain-containing protein [Anaerolineales bacterium]